MPEAPTGAFRFSALQSRDALAINDLDIGC